ncbi:MAG: efflux RND transporter periplasmic adaptor subunit [Chloroflexota bacterium]
MLITLVAFSCSSDSQSKQQPPKKIIPVRATAAVQKTVPVQITAIGNVESISTIAVKAQVGGILLRVHFKEGQYVNKGDLIFTIDPRPYEAALKQAEATLARDTVQFENATRDVGRYEELLKRGYVAEMQYDQVKANADALRATVEADRAAVENARLQLGYCYIRAPISGRTGSLIVNEGNLVKANADTAMVTINQVQPIYVSFSVPEKNFPEIKKHFSSGDLTVGAAAEGEHPVEGVATFIDNTVDVATGTIKLKATFDNKDHRLWPGQFVTVVMTLSRLSNAVVLPSQAILTGQSGQYVYVVKADVTVEARPVETGIAYGGETVISKGLSPGEEVVTDGQMLLVPGATVEVKQDAHGPEGTVSQKGSSAGETAR